MKQMICSLLAVFILAASTAAHGAPPTEKAPAPRLADDYYAYQNDALLAQTDIPSDASSWSYFYQLQQNTYQTLDGILQDTVKQKHRLPHGSIQQKIAALYLTAMDLPGRERGGYGALAPYLSRIKTASTVQEYATALLDIRAAYDISSLLSFVYEADLKDSAHYACYLDAPDLGLGKETFEDSSQSETVRGYQRYIARLLRADGMEETAALQAAAEIVAFEKDLAASALPLGEQNNPRRIYNVYTKEELQSLLPGINMNAALTAGDLQRDRYIVTQPALMQKLGGYLTQESLPLLKNYAVFHLLDEMAQYLTPQLRDIALEWKKDRDGSAAIKADQKLASELVQETMGFEFGKLYVERCFGEADKQAVHGLIRELIAVYKNKIAALDWMDEATKAAAQKKLRAMEIKVGYPDAWPDYYASAQLNAPQEGGILIDNILALAKSKTAAERRLFDKPVDRKQWAMTPQTINAYYNPSANEIVFPAAILQAPFYNRQADKATNLGGIGMVIAHEISHAFDNSGAQFDEMGNYRLWWTPEDKTHFEQLSQGIADYYSGFTALDGKYVDGRQTLGENIADLGGLSCAAAAAGNDPQKLRLLFEQYARIWAQKSTRQRQILLLSLDVHAPSKIRVNAVLRATDAFYLAYPEVKAGDGMYLPPEQRVKIW